MEGRGKEEGSKEPSFCVGDVCEREREGGAAVGGAGWQIFFEEANQVGGGEVEGFLEGFGGRELQGGRGGFFFLKRQVREVITVVKSVREKGRRVGMWMLTSWGCLKSEEEPMFRMVSFGSFDDGPSSLRLKALEGQRRWDRG